MHGLAWLPNAPDAEKLLSCDDSSQLLDVVDEVIAYVDELVSTINPGIHAAVYTYDTNNGWSKYIPANVYGRFNVSSHVDSLMTMYVRHNVNHYDVVTSVQ